MDSIAYFPGCSLQGTSREYHTSLMLVAQALQQHLEEIPDWLCCGATAAHTIAPHLATALAGDTLAKARAQGHRAILAPCAMCYSRLATTAAQMTESAPRQALEAALKLAPGTLEGMRALNVLDWLVSLGTERLLAPVTTNLGHLRLACYYGCLLVRPQSVTGVANVEHPHTMEAIVETTGAQSVTWNRATACCGASFTLGDKNTVFRLGREIIDDARKAGAQALVVACPMCHTNLDMRQSEFQPPGQRLPVLFITQLLGLAYGFSPAELGLKRHFIDALPLFQSPQGGSHV